MNDDKMTMLYRIGDGFLTEAHYGLALARVVNLPPRVLEVAESVSKALEQQMAEKKASSRTSALASRRKLLLALKSQLEELAKGPMNGEPLRKFLKKLQTEFVTRMEAIEDAERSSDVEERDVPTGSMEESVQDSTDETLSVSTSMLV